MHRIVHEHDAAAALGELIDLVPALADHTGAVSINDEAFDAIEYRLILRPAIDHGGFDVELAFIQSLRKQLATGVEFMLTWTVATATSKEYDFACRHRLKCTERGNG